MTRTRMYMQMVLGVVLGIATVWEATHDQSWFWMLILGGLAVLNIVSPFVRVRLTRKDEW